MIAIPSRSATRPRGVRRAYLGITGALLAATPALAGPPLSPHVVTAQPQTDSVVLTDYAATSPVTVQVLRGGVVIGASQPVIPGADLGRTIAEVNTVGAVTGACWRDHTPDIVYGDVVRAIQDGVAEDSVVQDVTVGAAQHASDSSVTVTGTAQSPNGTPLALAGLEEILLNRGLSNRRLRLLGTGGPDPGTLAFTAGATWAATFTGLSDADHDTALGPATVSTASWTNGAGTEVTEVEAYSTGGPKAPCAAPLLTEGITSVTPGAFVFDSTSLTIGGIAKNDVTAVNLAISDTNPFTADVMASAPVQTFGGGKAWSTTLPGSGILPLGDGSLTITPTFNPGEPSQRAGAARTITKDMVVPDTTPPVATIVSGPKPLVRSTTATFDLASTEVGTFRCRLDAAVFATCPDPTVLIGVTEGSHTLTVRARDAAGNLSADVIHSWQVDMTRPQVSARMSAAGRGILARRGIVIAATKCNERCTVSVEAKLVMPGAVPGRARVLARPHTFGARIVGLPKVRVTPAQLRAIRRSLRTGRSVRVFLNVTATDRVGNRTITQASARLTRADLG